MAWIELPDPAEVSGADGAALADAGALYGQVLEAWRAISLVDGVFPAYFAYLRTVVGPGRVPVRVKDLTAIRVGLRNGCRYTVSHRVASARRNGVEEADIIGVADPEGADYDEETAAALAFADELTVAPAAVPATEAPQAVGADTLARVRAVYDDGQCAELALSVSLWNALSRFHRVLALDLDMPEPPPELDPVR